MAFETSLAKTKMMNAIVEDPEIVLLFKEKYVDEDIWKYCIEQDPALFKKMKNPSDDLCLFACQIDGYNLKYIKNKFKWIKITQMMCIYAVKSNPRAILYVPRKFMNEGLKEIAFDGDPSLMSEFDSVRESYIEQLLVKKPFTLKYIERPDEDLICRTIKQTPEICPYINHMTTKMADVLKENWPDYYDLYKNNIAQENRV